MDTSARFPKTWRMNKEWSQPTSGFFYHKWEVGHDRWLSVPWEVLQNSFQLIINSSPRSKDTAASSCEYKKVPGHPDSNAILRIMSLHSQCTRIHWFVMFDFAFISLITFSPCFPPAGEVFVWRRQDGPWCAKHVCNCGGHSCHPHSGIRSILSPVAFCTHQNILLVSFITY